MLLLSAFMVNTVTSLSLATVMDTLYTADGIDMQTKLYIYIFLAITTYSDTATTVTPLIVTDIFQHKTEMRGHVFSLMTVTAI